MYNNPVFIGHGSPMNAISNNAYTGFLSAYARSIPLPEAVVVISAHWETEGTWITGNPEPGQIHDFWGFPDELYKTRYRPAGSRTTATMIRDAVPGIRIDDQRGIDHAGWAVVKHMYPDANVPLLELSLDTTRTERELFDLGISLSHLCDRGILFIGSGNVVHNLGDITFREQAQPFPWAVAADTWIKNRLAENDTEKLVAYRSRMPDYRRSMPTAEHFLPLLCILGMQKAGQRPVTIYEEIQNGSISMRSIHIS